MTACFSDPFPMFQPAMRIISSITNASPAVITTTIDHDFITGEIMRVIVPLGFGMTQINNLTGTITVTGTTTFSIDIDTLSFDIFAAPSPLPTAFTCSQIIPVGEISSTLAGATKNVLLSGDR